MSIDIVWSERERERQRERTVMGESICVEKKAILRIVGCFTLHVYYVEGF